MQFLGTNRKDDGPRQEHVLIASERALDQAIANRVQTEW
jgi:hypothetical protein